MKDSNEFFKRALVPSGTFKYDKKQEQISKLKEYGLLFLLLLGINALVFGIIFTLGR